MLKLLRLPILALALAACGGGSSPDAQTAPASTEPERSATVAPNAYPTALPINWELEQPLPEGHLLVWTQSNGLYSLSSDGAVQLSSGYGHSISPHGRYVASDSRPEYDPLTQETIASPMVFRHVDGSVITAVDDVFHVGPASWSPDDSTLAVPNRSGTRLVDIPSGQVRQLEIPSDFAMWSLDGTKILSLLSRSMVTVDPKSGVATEVPVDGNPNGIGLSPDGRFVTFMTGGGAPSAGPWQPGIYDAESGESCIVAPQTQYWIRFGNQGGPRLAWSPNSSHLVVTDDTGKDYGHTRVDVVEPATCAVQTIATGVVGLAWHPEGAALALSIRKDVTSLNADPSESRLNVWTAEEGLRSLGIETNRPTWSPDGSRVIASEKDMIRSIDVRDGSTIDVRLPSRTEVWQFSPSGRYLALLDRSEPQTERIYLLDFQTLEVSLLTRIPGGSGTIERVG